MTQPATPATEPGVITAASTPEITQQQFAAAAAQKADAIAASAVIASDPVPVVIDLPWCPACLLRDIKATAVTQVEGTLYCPGHGVDALMASEFASSRAAAARRVVVHPSA